MYLPNYLLTLFVGTIYAPESGRWFGARTRRTFWPFCLVAKMRTKNEQTGAARNTLPEAKYSDSFPNALGPRRAPRMSPVRIYGRRSRLPPPHDEVVSVH